jgi:hypothetical protein
MTTSTTCFFDHALEHLSTDVSLVHDKFKIALFFRRRNRRALPPLSADSYYELRGEVKEGKGYVRGGLSVPNPTLTIKEGTLTFSCGPVRWYGSFIADCAVLYAANAPNKPLITLSNFGRPLICHNGELMLTPEPSEDGQNVLLVIHQLSSFFLRPFL